MKYAVQTKLPGQRILEGGRMESIPLADRAWTFAGEASTVYKASKIALEVLGPLPDGARSRIVLTSELVSDRWPSFLREYSIHDDESGTVVEKRKGGAR